MFIKLVTFLDKFEYFDYEDNISFQNFRRLSNTPSRGALRPGRGLTYVKILCVIKKYAYFSRNRQAHILTEKFIQ